MMRFDLLSVEINHLFGFNVFFFKNVERGDAIFQYDLGLFYLDREDFINAKYWFEKAAEQGFVNAQTGLGNIYLVIEKNYMKAKQFFRKAAEQGEKCAQFNLGDMYSSVYKEYKEAEKWYRKAAAQNDMDAERCLIEIAELRARNLIKE